MNAANLPSAGQTEFTEIDEREETMIDVNCNIGAWPFRHLRLSSVQQLRDTMQTLGFTQLWVGHLDSLMHRDIHTVNERLAETTRAEHDEFFLPFGAVNPLLPDWEEDLRRVAEDYRMAGIRLHPGYHGYLLDDPRVNALMTIAMEKQLAVQIIVSMEDERTQHPLHRIPSVPIDPVKPLMESHPELRLMILNAFRSVTPAQAAQVTSETSVVFDTAMLEGIEGLARLVELFPIERLSLGTHSPLFYPDAAILKLTESGLPESVIGKISHDNAVNWLKVR